MENKYRIFVFIFHLFLYSFAESSSRGTIPSSNPKGPAFNIGIKLAWEFGRKSGLIFGFENSLVYLHGFALAGIVIGAQRNLSKKCNAIYGEFEAGTLVLGASIGSQYNFKSAPSPFYLRGWTGAFGYLSYRLPLINGAHEIGLVGKLPVGWADTYSTEK